VPELTQFFFADELEYDTNLLLGKNMSPQTVAEALEASQQRLRQLDSFDAISLEAVLRPLAVELGLKTGELFGALRVTTTGRAAAPPLFQTMAVLGRERCFKRIEAALKKLSSLA
jgi:glutamyl-tRNA synthetase